MPRCGRVSQNGITTAIQERNGMPDGRRFASVSVALALALALASMQPASTAPKQPMIDARVEYVFGFGLTYK